MEAPVPGRNGRAARTFETTTSAVPDVTTTSIPRAEERAELARAASNIDAALPSAPSLGFRGEVERERAVV